MEGKSVNFHFQYKYYTTFSRIFKYTTVPAQCQQRTFKPTLALHYENCPRIFAPEPKSPRFHIPFLPLKPTIFAPEILGNSDFAPYFCP